MKNRIFIALGVALGLGVLLLVMKVGGNGCAEDFWGKYEGYMESGTERYNVEMNFEKSEGRPFAVYFSTPEQSFYDGLSKGEVLNCKQVGFEVVGTGLVVSGEMGQDTFSGTIQQGEVVGNFSLEKVGKSDFYEESVSFEGSGGSTLVGTFSRPKDERSYAAVILLSGSGPQNRDENVFGFKVFVELANYLNSRGFAVLRFDDRGVGRSTAGEGSITTETFAEDAVAAWKYLQGRADVMPEKVGFLGHSEGSNAALIAANKIEGVAFVIMMAGPAVTGEEINWYQVTKEMEKGGLAGAQLEAAKDVQRAIVAAVKGKGRWEVAQQKWKALAVEQMGQSAEGMSPEELDEYVEKGIEQQLSSAKEPWFKFFIEYDPADDLKKLGGVPVLALYGGKDTQVPIDLSVEPFKSVADEEQLTYKVEVFEQANHLFQEAVSGETDEYVKLEKEFVSGFLQSVGDWLELQLFPG